MWVSSGGQRQMVCNDSSCSWWRVVQGRLWRRVGQGKWRVGWEGKVGSGKRVPYARHRSTCRYFANSQNPDEHQSQDLQSPQKKGTDQGTSAALCTAAFNVTFALILIYATVSIVVVLIYSHDHSYNSNSFFKIIRCD